MTTFLARSYAARRVLTTTPCSIIQCRHHASQDFQEEQKKIYEKLSQVPKFLKVRRDYLELWGKRQ